MLPLAIALTASVALIPAPVLAQSEYTVWSSVVFQRTGERTPAIINDDPTFLTSLGAQQAQTAGSFFRDRYITSQFSNTSENNGIGGKGAPVFGLATDIIDSVQVNANALDQQWNVASAYAFLQGLYPPWSPEPGNNSSQQGYLAPSNILANGSYIDAPLGGYQYPQVHVAGSYDPNFIYLSAFYDCPNHALAANNWDETPQFGVTEEEFAGIYDAVGSAVLLDVIPPATWQYGNAYPIYEYLQYQYTHNRTIQTTLDRYLNVTTNTSFMTTLRWLADEQNNAQLGNLTAYNPGLKSNGLPDGVEGSISTIAGNYLAWNVLSSLQNAIDTQGIANKLTLLFADYQPLTSFFALNSLADLNSDFAGTAEFGSSAAFELYSYANRSGPRYFPDEDNLMVRFYFRNGTDGDFYSHPLFRNGPSDTSMTWRDFKQGMQAMMMSSVGEWCGVCGAVSGFCGGYNATSTQAEHGISGNSSHHGLAPAVAGAIGAVVALAVAALLFAAIMLFGGVRLHRSPASRRRSSDLGGFKGGQKMRSDQDLTIPKSGATVIEREGPMSPTAVEGGQGGVGGHERVGSWELKQNQPRPQTTTDRAADADAHSLGRPSFVEDDEEARDPFAHGRPVVPHERV